jgi:hypothetical protein
MGVRMPKPTEELVKELADDPSAALELLPVVYGELRRLAAGFMGR